MKPWLIIIILVISLLIGWITATGSKGQWMRLIDVFIYGPFLIYAGIKIKEEWLGVILLIFGATTMAYNLNNYIILRHDG